MFLRRVLGGFGLFFLALCGAVLGSWIASEVKPVQFLSRKVLTPVVKPGEPVHVLLENYRVFRCPQTVYRIVNYPNETRDLVTRELPENFGKLGLDRYIAEIPTKANAVFGKANVYSYTESMCNPWQFIYPKLSGPWIDEFEFGPDTVRVNPENVPNSLVKQ